MTTTELKQEKADHINSAGGSFIEKLDIAMGGEGGEGRGPHIYLKALMDW